MSYSENDGWREDVTFSQILRIALAVANFGISLGIVTSFTLIMMAIYRQRRHKKPSNNIILSMCVTDFSMTVVTAPHFIMVAIVNEWPTNFLHCKILAFFSTFFGGMSILNLILIAIDRIIAIFYPTKYKYWLNDRNCRILCFGFWMYSGLIASCVAIEDFSQPLFDGDIMTCILSGKDFLLLQLLAEVIPSFISTAICYIIIVYKLVKRSANIYSKTSSKVNYEIRMAKIGGVVSLFFITTYLPYYTIMFAYRKETNSFIKLLSAVIIVSSYNFDAFMYGYCNKNYRRDIKRYLNAKIPWIVKIKPVESTDTNPDTNNTTFANSAVSGGAAKSHVKAFNRKSTIKELDEKSDISKSPVTGNSKSSRSCTANSNPR